jgi:ATP-dependent Clp protease ATP-binding subunit ClpA
MEVDSMPAEIDAVQRRLMQLQIEREALKKERDHASKARLDNVKREIAELEESARGMRAQWIRTRDAARPGRGRHAAGRSWEGGGAQVWEDPRDREAHG